MIRRPNAKIWNGKRSVEKANSMGLKCIGRRINLSCRAKSKKRSKQDTRDRTGGKAKGETRDRRQASKTKTSVKCVCGGSVEGLGEGKAGLGQVSGLRALLERVRANPRRNGAGGGSGKSAGP